MRERDDTPSFADKLRRDKVTYVIRTSDPSRSPLPPLRVEGGLHGIIPTLQSQIFNDDFTVKDEYYVHTDNNFSDQWKKILSEASENIIDLRDRVIYKSGVPNQTIDGKLTITDDVKMKGDLDVYGNITHHGTLYTSNDFIVLREREENKLKDGDFTGLVAHNYNGKEDGGLIFGNDGIGRIGDISYIYTEVSFPDTREECDGLYYIVDGEYVAVDNNTDLTGITQLFKKTVGKGDTQALATRLDADHKDMVDKKVVIWDEEHQIMTAPDFSYAQTTDTKYIDSDDKTISYLDSIEVDQNGRVSKTNVKTTTLHRTWRPIKVNDREMLVSIDDKTVNFKDGSSIIIEEKATDGTITISVNNKANADGKKENDEKSDAFQFLMYNTEGLITGVKSTAYQQHLKINGNVLGVLYGTNTDSADIHLYGAESQIEESTDKRYLLGSQKTTDMARTNTDSKVYSKDSKLFSNDSEVVNLADDQSIAGIKTHENITKFRKATYNRGGVIFTNDSQEMKLYEDDTDSKLYVDVDNNKFLLMARDGKVYSNNSETVNIDDDQIIKANKQFDGLIKVGGNIMPTTTETQDIGNASNRFNNLYAKTIRATDIFGKLTGNADTADKVNHDLVLENGQATKDVYNGSAEKILSNYYMDRFTNQDLNGIKTFNDNVNIGSVSGRANLSIVGDISIAGNITQNGSAYITHAEEVYTTKDYIYLREGATGALTNGSYTGLEFIKYDGTHNGRLVVDNTGTARVGDVGDEQPLTTRDEIGSMADKGLTYWDGNGVKLKTITPGTKGYFLLAGDGTEPVWTDPTTLLIGEASKITHKITFANGKGITDTFDGSADKTIADKYLDLFNDQEIGGIKTYKDYIVIKNSSVVPTTTNDKLNLYVSGNVGYVNSDVMVIKTKGGNDEYTFNYSTESGAEWHAFYPNAGADLGRLDAQHRWGNLYLKENADITGSVKAGVDVLVGQDLTVNRNTEIKGNTALKGTLEVDGTIKLNDTLTTKDIVAQETLKSNIGSETIKYKNIYAETLKGNATSADKVNHNLVLQTSATDTANYNGSENKTLSDYYIDRFTAQSVNGIKTFEDNVNINANENLDGTLNIVRGADENYIYLTRTGVSNAYIGKLYSNTDNELLLRTTNDFMIMPYVGDTADYSKFTFNAYAFHPGKDNFATLGTETIRWKDIYVAGDIIHPDPDGNDTSFTEDIKKAIKKIMVLADYEKQEIDLYDDYTEKSKLGTLTKTDVRKVIATNVTANTDKYVFVNYDETGLITSSSLRVYKKKLSINGTDRYVLTDTDEDLTPIYAPTESGSVIGDQALLVWSETQGKPVWQQNTSAFIHTNNLTYDDPTDVLHVLGAYQGKVLDDKITSLKGYTDDTFLPLAGGTVTGQVTVKTNLIDIDDTETISHTRYRFTDFRDKDDDRIGVVGAFQRTDGKYGMYLQAGNQGAIRIFTDGTSVYTSVPNPSANSNDSSIATTSWTKARLDSYLPLAGGTMVGNIIMPNNVQIKGKKTDGTAYNMVSYNANNDLILGHTGAGMFLNSAQLTPLVASGAGLTHNMSLGAPSVPWKALYVRGANISGATVITGNLTVNGKIYNTGDTYQTHAQEVFSKNDYIVMRDGVTGALANNSYSGFDIRNVDGAGTYTADGKYNNDGDDVLLVADNQGVARVGKRKKGTIATGALQPIATRDEASDMIANGVAYWDATNKKLKTYNIKTATGVTHANYSNSDAVNKIIPTMGFMAYWNGAYNSNNTSNLKYSANGEIVGSKAGTTQIIEGTKKFKSEVIKEQVNGYAGFAVKNTGYTLGSSLSSTIGLGRFITIDSDDNYMTYMQTIANTDGEIRNLLAARQKRADNTYIQNNLAIVVSATDKYIQSASRIIPEGDGVADLGESTKRWKKGYFGNDGIKVGDCNIQYNSTTKALEFSFD